MELPSTQSLAGGGSTSKFTHTAVGCLRSLFALEGDTSPPTGGHQITSTWQLASLTAREHPRRHAILL